jgi:hypothetical protein
MKNNSQIADKRPEPDCLVKVLFKIDGKFIDGLTFKQYLKIGVLRKNLWFWRKTDVVKITKNKELLSLWVEAVEIYQQLKERGYYK